MILTFERASELLRYDPETGIITWIVTRGSHIRSGCEAGCQRRDGYRLIRVDGHLYLSHRIAWLLKTGEVPPPEIDHINGEPRDNRWVNLRAVTHSQNIQNQTAHRDNVIGVKGIRQHRNGRFYVTVKSKSCGGYSTLEEAKEVYRKIAEKELGDFYRL